MKTVFDQNTEERLDKYLTSKLKISRSQVQAMIKDGDVLVDGKGVKAHLMLHSGMIIESKKGSKKSITAKKLEPNKTVKFKVIKNAIDYTVIEKPAGLIVHPTDQGEGDTLANGLIAKFPKIVKVGDNLMRPGIVHRLDKDVSGLMVIAKNQKMFEHLKKQFQSREIDKFYLALVHGRMEKPEGVIDFKISRSKNSGKMAAMAKSSEAGKEALTKWVVKEYYPHFSYLEVKIETGRTHQIRVHLNAIEHPVVGDRLYTQKVKQSLPAKRLFLHATHLAFKDLKGKLQTFDAPLPLELMKILTNLKNP